MHDRINVQNNPVNWIDPLGLWTVQAGFGFNSGAGVGTTKSIGFAVSYSKSDGLQIGGYAAAGIGAHAAVTGDIVADITWSSNDSIESLNGTAITTGGGIATPNLGPHAGVGVEVNLPTDGLASPSYTVSPGIGIGTPAELHTYMTKTWTKTWIKIGGDSENCP